MNAQSIWSGEEYAYTIYKPNKTFIMNAYRGRCIRTFKQREFGNSKMSNYVEIQRLDVETGEAIGEPRNVRARDVIDFWDSYKNERDAILKKREESERLAQEARMQMLQEREERLQREREEREAALRVEAERKELLVNKFVERTGIPRDAIYSVGPGSIQLDRTMLEVWLSVNGNPEG